MIVCLRHASLDEQHWSAQTYLGGTSALAALHEQPPDAGRRFDRKLILLTMIILKIRTDSRTMRDYLSLVELLEGLCKLCCLHCMPLLQCRQLHADLRPRLGSFRCFVLQGRQMVPHKLQSLLGSASAMHTGVSDDILFPVANISAERLHGTPSGLHSQRYSDCDAFWAAQVLQSCLGHPLSGIGKSEPRSSL